MDCCQVEVQLILVRQMDYCQRVALVDVDR
jgi:hypothetical protein